jgi:hypothetical protein
VPRTRRTDQVITLEQLRHTVNERPCEALVLRTLPNDPGQHHQATGAAATRATCKARPVPGLRSIGVKHLLLDLPSVDREEDGGVLAAHHAFWDHPATRWTCERTITELLHRSPAEVRDGDFLLELQLPHFMNDAAPSRPVLYACPAMTLEEFRAHCLKQAGLQRGPALRPGGPGVPRGWKDLRADGCGPLRERESQVRPRAGFGTAGAVCGHHIPAIT